MMKDPVPSYLSGLGRGVRGGAGEGKGQLDRFPESPPILEPPKQYRHEAVRRTRRRSRSSPVRLRCETNEAKEGGADSPVRRRSPSASPSSRQRNETSPQVFWSPLLPTPPVLMPSPTSLEYTSKLSYFSAAPPTQPVSLVALPYMARQACPGANQESARGPKKESRSARRTARYVLRTLIKTLPLPLTTNSISNDKINADLPDGDSAVECSDPQKYEACLKLEDETLAVKDNSNKQSLNKEEKNLCPRCSRCAGELNSTQLRLLLRHLRQLAHIDRLHRALRRAAR